MSLSIEIVPCRTDNYAYLIADANSGTCAVVDPAEPAAVSDRLHGRRLTHILNTHHHADHTGGNLELKRAFGARILGAAGDAARIPGLDEGVSESGGTTLFGEPLRILETPGHTAGAICFALADAVFTGDTLFAMGCGRLFEGDAPTMLASLGKIAALPDGTLIYCGHEYAEKNLAFALTLEPGNAALQARRTEIAGMRERGGPAVPFTLATEKATNPFLRTHSPEIRAKLHLVGATDADVLAEIRRRRDEW
jgi:hydroxyacylglutathione hydrolase